MWAADSDTRNSIKRENLKMNSVDIIRWFREAVERMVFSAANFCPRLDQNDGNSIDIWTENSKALKGLKMIQNEKLSMSTDSYKIDDWFVDIINYVSA